MSVSKHIRLFDRIARPYGWFYQVQTRGYLRLVQQYLPDIGLPAGSSVLDVGCGPGPFGAAFKHFGFSVTGVDGSPKMASIALSNGLECRVADATEKVPFPDRSFDMATAAYLAHGFPREHRVKLFHEMNRVADRLVILHDFSPAAGGFRLGSVTGFLEKLERSDYVEFRKHGLEELRQIFPRVDLIQVDKQLSWYVCRREAA